MLPYIVFKLILVLVILGLTLLIATYSTYAERKIAAFMQDRLGPDRAGKFGLLQPIADAVKFFTKEDFIPAGADRVLFTLAPAIAMSTALMASVVIPFGNSLILNGMEFPLQVANLNIGVLYISGVVSIGVYGIMLGGWASNNKYSLLGSIRAASQMISYEIGMGIAMVAIIMMSGSMSLHDIVQQQAGPIWKWNIFVQPLGFIIFCTCAFAECNRTPFDLPECEQELVGGYHTEYSSMKLGLFLFAEYVNMFVSSALMSAMYFGGYNIPWIEHLNLPHNVETAFGSAFFFIKIFFFIAFFMFIRWTIPRFRYDQLMHLGWRILMPLAIVNMLLTGIILLLIQ